MKSFVIQNEPDTSFDCLPKDAQSDVNKITQAFLSLKKDEKIGVILLDVSPHHKPSSRFENLLFCQCEHQEDIEKIFNSVSFRVEWVITDDYSLEHYGQETINHWLKFF